MNPQLRLLAHAALLASLTAACSEPTAEPTASDAAALAKSNSAVQRPIQDFLSTQGTYCLDDGQGGCALFLPPAPNIVGWGFGPHNAFLIADYAGVWDAWLSDQSGGAASVGTTESGTVSERPMADGRASVVVHLNTDNAIVWVSYLNDQLDDFPGTSVLGNRLEDILTGATAALGRMSTHLEFINTAPGAPLPDLVQLLFAPLPGQEWTSVRLGIVGHGELHPAFGQGVAEGTPGRVVFNTTCLMARSAPPSHVLGLCPGGTFSVRVAP